MTRDTSRCAVPADVLNGYGQIYLREPLDADVHDLKARLRQGDYSKPFVMDDGAVRSLHFSPAFVQSAMSLDQPHALNLAYTRKMMGFLLFLPRPKHVVVVGLGGGSLTKFCHGQLPRARITTVEKDEDVIGFSDFFDVPAQDERMRIVHADAVEYFATTEERADVILLDGCDACGIAPEFGNPRFYQNLRARLQPRGILVANLVGPPDVHKMHRRLIADTFPGQVIVQNVATEGNRVVFAFNDPWRAPDWSVIERDARKLARRHGLDFPAFARKLQRSYARQVLGSSGDEPDAMISMRRS
ncbi:MAG: hypothetical protein P4L83_19680 [Nevskia sp.]|nr:hypothetical protein [Nevskia sp.]